jgi:hypothetical protein
MGSNNSGKSASDNSSAKQQIRTRIRLSSAKSNNSSQGNSSSDDEFYDDEILGNEENYGSSFDHGISKRSNDFSGNLTARLESVLEESNNNSVASSKEKVNKKISEWTQKYIKIIASNNVVVQAKAAKVLEFLLDSFEHTFLMCRHLELICDLFQDLGETSTSEYFGTYRVELVSILFCCIVDLHNFEIVLRVLSAFEVACLYCRIGWLHIFNPMKAEGGYELDLGRREERIVMKVISSLSIREIGINFSYLTFQWDRQMDPMPGYELTAPWLTEEVRKINYPIIIESQYEYF